MFTSSTHNTKFCILTEDQTHSSTHIDLVVIGKAPTLKLVERNGRRNVMAVEVSYEQNVLTSLILSVFRYYELLNREEQFYEKYATVKETHDYENESPEVIMGVTSWTPYRMYVSTLTNSISSMVRLPSRIEPEHIVAINEAFLNAFETLYEYYSTHDVDELERRRIAEAVARVRESHKEGGVAPIV